MKEHNEYEAQGKYAEMLMEALKVSKWHFIERLRLFFKAEDFRDSHRGCCEWASEED